ncbi:hypothetical protein SISNIDRAFT_96858 [Sistotremastrum niveocremeum HHB9708]|uniref:Deoxycytidylate deaminase n=1 Tax=Sistotremastrum niveocremeum HHB9708 TaxID=1314777 RepID=A0A164U8Q4_9AGAM|nr:hypothetical protein SISNIDRAFT_96858 [Sistotremastrum niveocremeum HHB9708]
MLDYVTRQWTSNFVTLDLTELRFLELFTRRPFCLIVTVDAPITVRYQRYARMIGGEPSLHSFLEDHDRVVYGAGTDLSSSSQSLPQATPLTSLVDVANIKVTNVFGSLAEYHAQLEELNLLDPERTRPSWDSYFMRLASLAARRSNCMKRRVGAVLVRDKRIISTGYNGTPRGLANCNEGGCRRCNGGAASGTALEECVCLHAEENALLEAGRERVGVNAVLYCDTCPCLRCSVKIAQVGIKEVVYSFDYKMDEASARLLNAAGVTIRKHRTTSI